MKTIALLSVGLLVVGCGTTVIGDAIESEVGGNGNRGGATAKGGASGVGGSSSPICAGTIVDTAASCLFDDAYCIELPDGRYCTGPGSGAGGAGGSGPTTSGGAGGTSPIGAAGTDYVPRGGMGGTPSTLVGGTGGTGGTTTQPVTKAYCGGSIVSSTGCYMDDAYCFRLNETQFCTGVGKAPCPDGMIEGSTADCSGQSWCWQQGMSGSCRLPLRTSEECVASGGQAITYIGGGSTLCPNGLVHLGPIALLGLDSTLCCGTTVAPFTNGIPDIDAASRCGGRLAGTKAECDANGFCFLVFNGQYCTGTENMRCPPSTQTVPSSACPTNASWCWQFNAESACTLPTRTTENCRYSGGEVLTDPGDGSLMRNGCPDGHANMGLVSPSGEEGALCCSR